MIGWFAFVLAIVALLVEVAAVFALARLRRMVEPYLSLFGLTPPASAESTVPGSDSTPPSSSPAP